MNNKSNNAASEKMPLANIVGETKKIIMDETDPDKGDCKECVTDEDVKKAVERINPDPNSLKSRG